MYHLGLMGHALARFVHRGDPIMGISAKAGGTWSPAQRILECIRQSAKFRSYGFHTPS